MELQTQPTDHMLQPWTVQAYDRYIMPFAETGMKDLPRVGGKNASLGEMYSLLQGKGIRVPNGFAVTTEAYNLFLDQNGLRQTVETSLARIDRSDYHNLHEVGAELRTTIMLATLPQEVEEAILVAYRNLSGEGLYENVAVRSSATAEDLPGASFAGQQETYLHITSEEALVNACRKCYASLFTDRAIKYREDNHFDHMKVGLSIGVQKMVRSDKGCSGVAFTIDPDSGFENVLVITGSWGLGENVVQGTVTPDEFVLFKGSLYNNKRALISRKLGAKEKTMVFADDVHSHTHAQVCNVDTPAELRNSFVLSEAELTALGRWMLIIEEHYRRPMDIEWAKDGLTGELWILQARPETVRSREQHLVVSEYTLQEQGRLLAHGVGLGNKIVTGKARILHSPRQASELQTDEILVADLTSPDWDPVLKRAGAIVTNKGGRTSHAAIVARELGTPAVVGAGNATSMISSGEDVTVVCDASSRGDVFERALQFTKTDHAIGTITIPTTKPMLILADPDQAFRLSYYPNAGVGLLRLEFIITNHVKVHPMALVRFDELRDPQAISQITEITRGYDDKRRYFVEKLAQGVATIAAAFYPKDVIVRMSDFKTNEYANLVGGTQFEPHEENPMLGFRGASRYYHPLYRPGFELECQAMRMVRDEMGLTNVKLMIPFCRTVDEGAKVIRIMAEQGLVRGEDRLEIYVMAEIPSNIVLAEQFAEIFDGFSIGSNDLTQLTLGLDRDSTIIRDLFDERNAAPLELIAEVIRVARFHGRKIGFCGQAPSDHPEFAEFLVEQHIDSISFNPDALLRGIENIRQAEIKHGVIHELFSTQRDGVLQVTPDDEC